MISIRDASPDEIEHLMKLWDELERAQGPYRVFELGSDARDAVREELLEAASAADRRLIVAEADGTVVGMASASVRPAGGMTEERAVFLSRVVVDPSSRGRGVGRALVDAAEAFGRDHGATHLVAYVFSGNVDGLRVWDALGFTDRFVQKVRPISR